MSVDPVPMMSAHGALPIRKRQGGTVLRLTLLVAGIAATATACASVPSTGTTASEASTTKAAVAAASCNRRWCRHPRRSTTTTRPAVTTTTTRPAPTTTRPVTTTAPSPAAPAPSAPAPQPPAGSRDARTWPFASTSPWNMPRGDGATFDGRQVANGGNINSANGWGVSVAGAGYPLVNQATAGNVYYEGHVSIIRADGVTADEWYQYYNLSNPNRNSSVTNLLGDGLHTNAGPGTGVIHQQRASQVSQLGGLIRLADLNRGVIPHALSVALPSSTLRLGWVWPAFGQDGDAASVYHGFVPMGSLLAIPSGVAMPSGLSPAGQMIWTALRDYGAYVVDRTGPSSVLVAEAAAQGAVGPAIADMSRIMSQVRMVTNNSQAGPGGPGNRLAPLAPPLG
jgi:hypothetical protein